MSYNHFEMLTEEEEERKRNSTHPFLNGCVKKEKHRKSNSFLPYPSVFGNFSHYDTGLPYEFSEQWGGGLNGPIIYRQEFHETDLFFEVRTHLSSTS